jgi:hypothetical protein
MSKRNWKSGLVLAAIGAAGLLGGLGVGAMKAQAAGDITTQNSISCSSCMTQYRTCLANGTPKETCVQQYHYCAMNCS